MDDDGVAAPCLHTYCRKCIYDVFEEPLPEDSNSGEDDDAEKSSAEKDDDMDLDLKSGDEASLSEQPEEQVLSAAAWLLWTLW